MVILCFEMVVVLSIELYWRFRCAYICYVGYVFYKWCCVVYLKYEWMTRLLVVDEVLHINTSFN